jgi:hypothetical protein
MRRKRPVRRRHRAHARRHFGRAEKLSYDHYGLPIYKADDGNEYAVGTKAQAMKAAKANILESLWAFNTDFIARFAGLDERAQKAVSKMQADMSEDANDIVRKLIGESKLKKFVKAAIDADGLGHFLSPYDSEERNSSDIEGLPKGKLAFRTN